MRYTPKFNILILKTKYAKYAKIRHPPRHVTLNALNV